VQSRKGKSLTFLSPDVKCTNSISAMALSHAPLGSLQCVHDPVADLRAYYLAKGEEGEKREEREGMREKAKKLGKICSSKFFWGQCDNYNLKSHRRCNNMSRVNLSGYIGHVTILS